MTATEFVSRLASVTKTGNGWQARCPAHEDVNASLSVSEGRDGRTIVHCHAGCRTEDVLAKLDLRVANLFNGEPQPNGKAQITATYDYTDEAGALLFQVVRFEPKGFRQRKPDGAGGWTWKTSGVRRVLFRLPELLRDVQRGLPVFVCEGEKDVLALVKNRLSATCNPGGAGKWRGEYSATLCAADVIVIADKDTPGRKHAHLVARSLNGIAKRVRVLELPDVNGKAVKDTYDFFAAGGDVCQLQDLVDAAPDWTPIAERLQQTPLGHVKSANSESVGDSRPKVRLPGDDYLLSETANEMGAILAPRDIFSRGEVVFKINDRRDGLAPMMPETFRTWVEDHLIGWRYRKIGDNESVPVDRTLTKTDADGILASPQFNKHLRPIERLNPIRMPVMRHDGRIELLQPGYDRETKSFTFDAVQIDAGMQVDAAKQILDTLFCEFAFADADRSKAVAIAAMLTVFAVGVLPLKSLRPVFIFVANAEGAGKTLLVKIATVPVLGYTPTGTKPKDEDEMRKVLLAAVMEARQVIFFDNVKGHLQSAALEGFVTSQDFEGRILGLSKSFRGQNSATVFVTGNSCTVSPDMRRRSLFSEVFLEVERAEDRVFRNNLEVPMLLEKRSEILSALWALIQDWDKAGKPGPSRGNSSFSDWANIIGGIVQHAGYGCPLESPQIESAADTDGTDMRGLVKAIAAGAKLRVATFNELTDAARSEGLFIRIIPEDGDLDHKAKASFGAMLRRYDRRLIGGYRFTLIGKGRNRRFQVEEVKP